MRNAIRRGGGALIAGILTILGGAGLAHAAVPTLEETHRFEPASGARAGNDVALEGDYALYTVNRGSEVGVSRRSGSTWDTEILARPGGALPTSYFGAAVALSPDARRAFVSAPREQKIYSFTRSGTNTWTAGPSYEAPTLTRVSTWSNTFAEALAYSDGRLLVGAPNATVDTLSNAGAGLVLDVSGGSDDGSWRALLPAVGDVVFNQILGQSVAFDDDVAVLGAPQYFRDGSRTGAAYLFDLDGNSTPRLLLPETGPAICHPATRGGPAFGITLAMADGLLAVGSPEEKNRLDGDTSSCAWSEVTAGDTVSGALYRFSYDGTPVGTKLLPQTGRHYFGQTVGLSSDLMLVGAMNDDAAGRLLAFDLAALSAERQPASVQELVPSDSAPNDGFGGNTYGQGPAISGEAALVGAPWKRSSAGSVFYFRPLRHASTLSVSDTEVEYRQDADITVRITHPDPDAELILELDGASHVIPVEGARGVFEAPDLDVGSYPVQVRYQLDADTVLATAESTHTVTKAPTTLTLGTSRAAAPGEEVTLTGVLTAPYGAVAGVTVTLTVNSGTPIEAVTGPEGRYTARAVLPAVGDEGWEITAAFAGDRNHVASQAQAQLGTQSPSPTPSASPSPSQTATPSPGTDELPFTGADGVGAMALLAGLMLAGGLFLVVRART